MAADISGRKKKNNTLLHNKMLSCYQKWGQYFDTLYTITIAFLVLGFL